MDSLGFFKADTNEYVITGPRPPRPLLNYLWNDRILAAVNHMGSGLGGYGGRSLTYVDPAGKGRANVIKNGSRFFYLADCDSGAVWNPGGHPAAATLDDFSCTVGLGYSRIASGKDGIASVFTVMVNAADPCEIWSIQVKNTGTRPRRLKLYSYVEFALTGYPVYCNYYAMVFANVFKKENLIVAHNHAQERPHEWYNGFMASDRPVTGFDTSVTSFLGVYGSAALPESVRNRQLAGKTAMGEDLCGALEHTLELAAGEEVRFHVIVGAADSNDTARAMAAKLFRPGKIEADFQALVQDKARHVETIIVETPDEKLNCLTNSWIKQQIQLCAEIGRDTGKGFRDQLQDAWGIASFNPKLAREKITETLQYQYADGSCVRGWLPLDTHLYSDGPTWIAPTIDAYLKETGDFDFLQLPVPYLDQGAGTVWEHILKAMRYSSSDLGERGLVKARAGDWNDSLNGIGAGGKGESVWTSIAAVIALHRTADIAMNVLRDPAVANEMRERAARLTAAVNDTGWDGEWYLAGYTDKGARVGSHRETEGRVYLNSQTWAIIAGIAEGERLDKCLAALDTYLDSPCGPLTLYPTYTRYNPEIGRLTGFIPGIWENGTPYCHGGTFKIVSDCVIGRGDDAYKTVTRILPDNPENPCTYSGCEPYALTNMYFGPDHPEHGKTLFAWVTGTAGWMFRAITQYMLGFHPGYDGFEIKPCLPSHWEKCTLKRKFRNDTYLITILNPNRSQSGVASVTLDGVPVAGSTVPLVNDGQTHTVTVTMK